MSEQKEELKIHVTSDFDGTGFAQAAAAAKAAPGVAGGGDAASNAAAKARMREMIAGYTSQRAEIMRMATATGKASGFFDGLRQSMGKVANAGQALNRIMPGLGNLMQLAFSPIGATISIAAVALRVFKGYIDGINESFKACVEDGSKPMIESIKAQREAFVSLNSEFLKAGLEVYKVATAEQTMAEKTAQATKVAEEQKQAKLAILEAELKQDKSFLELGHKAGLLSDQQYHDELLKQEIDHIKKKRKIQEDAAAEELATKKKDVATAEGELPGLKDEQSAAIAKRVAAQTALKRNVRPDDAIAADLKKTQDELAVMEADLGGKKAGKFAEFGFGANSDEVSGSMVPAGTNQHTAAVGLVERERVKKQYQDWVAKSTDLKRLQLEAKNAPEAESRLSTAVATAQTDEEIAKGKVMDRQRFVTEGQREIAREEARLGRSKATGKTEDAAAIAAARLGYLGTTPLGSAATVSMDYNLRTADRIQAGQGVSAQDVNTLVATASQIVGKPIDLKAAIQVMEYAAKDSNTRALDTEKLVSISEQQILAMQKLHQNVNGYMSRIQSMEEQMKNIIQKGQ